MHAPVQFAKRVTLPPVSVMSLLPLLLVSVSALTERCKRGRVFLVNALARSVFVLAVVNVQAALH